MDVIAVIPARYASSRFEGKLLAKDTGKYLIQHVYEQAIQAQRVEQVLIATDDERIGQACDEFGAPWRMTRTDHASGTDRIAEVISGIEDVNIVVNVQGDEPEIDPANIDRLVELIQSDDQADMATLCALVRTEQELENPNVVKVVMDQQGRAMYFSRWAIPFERDLHSKDHTVTYYKHLGLYAYRRDALLRLSQLAPTPLEQTEKLEQLRALEHGMKIAITPVHHNSVGIDTSEQYQHFVARYKETSA